MRTVEFVHCRFPYFEKTWILRKMAILITRSCDQAWWTGALRRHGGGRHHDVTALSEHLCTLVEFREDFATLKPGDFFLQCRVLFSSLFGDSLAQAPIFRQVIIRFRLHIPCIYLSLTLFSYLLLLLENL